MVTTRTPSRLCSLNLFATFSNDVSITTGYIVSARTSSDPSQIGGTVVSVLRCQALRPRGVNRRVATTEATFTGRIVREASS